MSKLILFHGSKNIIEKPIFGYGKNYNDYGLGFYCTENEDLAKEWACTEDDDGYCNKYELAIDDLNILDLTSNEYTVLNWLAILLDNRIVKLSTPIAVMGREYILKNFLVDYKKYDLIKGYRADDSYFSFVRAFLSNEISIEQLGKAMKLGKLGEQIVLISEKAFINIKFLEYNNVQNSIYYPKRKNRDEQARRTFFSSLDYNELDGIFMRDIIKEEIKNDDKRIR